MKSVSRSMDGFKINYHIWIHRVESENYISQFPFKKDNKSIIRGLRFGDMT